MSALIGPTTPVTRLFAIKTANEIRLTDTRTTDSELQFTLPVGTWRIELVTRWQNESTAVGNYQQIFFSGTATTAAGHFIYQGSTGTTLNQGTAPNASDANIFAPVFGSAAASNTVTVFATLVVTVAGTLSIKWGQAAAGADDTVLLKGSYLLADLMASS